MKNRFVYFMLGIFISFGVAFILMQSEMEETEEEKLEARRRGPALYEKMKKIFLKNPSGEFTLALEGQRWMLTYPLKYNADQREVYTIISALRRLTPKRILEDVTEKEREDYGLLAANYSIRLSSGEATYGITIGKNAPTQNQLYAMLTGDSRVFLVNSAARGLLGKSLYDLRDKSVFMFDSGRLSGFEFETVGAEIKVHKDKQGTWRLNEPQGARASAEKIEKFTGLIRKLEVKAFTDDSPEDISQYGLLEPAAILKFHCAAPQVTEILYLGESTSENSTCYAMKPGSNRVFELDREALNEALQNISNLRQKVLVSIPGAEINKIEIESGDRMVFSAIRVDGPHWDMLLPNKGALEPFRMGNFLLDLVLLEAKGFIDRPQAPRTYRLNPADYLITLSSEEGTEVIKVGVVEASAEQSVYAMRDDEECVFSVDTLMASLLSQEFENMLESSLEPASAIRSTPAKPISFE